MAGLMTNLVDGAASAPNVASGDAISANVHELNRARSLAAALIGGTGESRTAPEPAPVDFIDPFTGNSGPAAAAFNLTLQRLGDQRS